MRSRLIVCFTTLLTLGAVAAAQTTTITSSIDIQSHTSMGSTFYAPDFFAVSTFVSGCVISFTTTNTNPNVATSMPTSGTSQGNSQVFSISTMLVPPASGTTTITITYTYVGTGCPTGTTVEVLNVTVGAPTGGPPTEANTPNTGTAAEPVSTSTGELFGQDETADLSLGGPTGLEFRRYYAANLSANKVSSALGTNWMHNFDVSLAVSGTSATVTLFRGKTVTFTQSNNAWTLSSNEQRPYQLAAASGGGYQFLDPRSNLIYSFNSGGAPTSIQDRNGNTITVTQGPNGPTQVSDGLGRTLTFSYMGTNLTGVQDQSGRNVSFQYSNSTPSSWTDANGHQTTFAYTASGGINGLMTAETRPAGNQPFTQTFDSTGRVATQSDSFSNTMTLAYVANNGGATLTETAGVTLTEADDANLNMISASDPSGGVSKYAYDANNRPITTTDRLGNTSTATWDPASGLPATSTDELGNITSYTYTASTIGPFTFYDLATVRYADGTTIALTRDSKGNVTSLTDQAGNTWHATYTTNGWLATVTNPAGGVYTFSYNSDGTRASVETPSSDTTKFGYDSVSRLIRITNPDSTAESLQYDAVSNLLKATDERNDSLSATFDANNNPKTTIDAVAATSNFAFDTDDRLASDTDPLGNAVMAAWDTQSRLMSVTDATGNKRVWTYDNLNRVTAIADASGNGLTYGLDGENRPTSITDALSRAVSYKYDAHGNVIGMATPKLETFSYLFDKLNRQVSATDPLGRTAQYTWDPRGLLSAVLLPGGVGASFGFNSLRLPTTVTDPLGKVWSRVYDNMGRLTSSADPLNRASSFTYDSRQRSSSATFPIGAPQNGTAQYSYDATSNLTALQYSDGTSLSFTYDADNRMTAASGLTLSYDSDGRITNSNGLRMTYDAAGRIASVTYAPGKTVNYAYNNRGLISQVTDWVGGNTTFTYDAAAQLTTISYANGVTQTYTWDADGRALTLTVSNGGTTLSSIALTRDALGRVTSATEPSANVPTLAAGVLPLAYDAADQVTGETFDGLGRVTQDALRAYKWDLASRLTSYTGSDGSASFTYDAMGQRVSRTSSGTTQNYLWNYVFPLPCLSTVQSAGADQTYYVWLPDGTLIESISAADNTRRFYHFDESGSALLLTDGTGAVTDTYAISVYGEAVGHTGSTANPFTWQGQFGVMSEGATSMYYMRARYYDSGPARFLSRDPESSTDPRAANPYQYAYGDPVQLLDPAGTGPSDRSNVQAMDAHACYVWVYKDGTQLTDESAAVLESDYSDRGGLTVNQWRTYKRVQVPCNTPLFGFDSSSGDPIKTAVAQGWPIKGFNPPSHPPEPGPPPPPPITHNYEIDRIQREAQAERDRLWHAQSLHERVLLDEAFELDAIDRLAINLLTTLGIIH